MALDFPPGTPGATYTGPNGVIWSWDGAKWLSGTGTTVYAPITDAALLGNPTAPTPAAGDADTSIATTKFVSDAVATSLHDVGRNYLHNSMFNVQQRGQGPWSASGGVTADRWPLAVVGGGAITNTIATLADADRTAIGDESARFAINSSFVGTAGANDYTFCAYQGIENVRRLSGKTVTVSFWAKANAGTPKLGLSVYQYFGSGGSASVGVGSIGPQPFTLSATWTRYISAPIAIPSMIGKTLGTDGLDQTQIIFCGSSGASSNAGLGSPGVQSYVLQLWGVQLEVGNVATPLEKLDPVTQLQQCQRFYCVLRQLSMIASGAATQALGQTCALPVPMHHVPGLAFANTTYGNMSGITASNVQPTSVLIFATLVGSAGGQWTTDLLASADL